MSENNLVPFPTESKLEKEIPEVKTPCSICSNESVRKCSKCNNDICASEISNMDLTQCINCSPSVEINVNKETKNETDYDEWTDEIKLHSYEAKHVQVTGSKWLTATVAISQLSDSQLKNFIEFHKVLVSQLELELTTRKIKRTKAQLAAHPFGTVKRRIVSTETTKTKTVRTKKIIDPMEQLMALADAGKISLDQLQNLLQQRLGKKA